MNIEKVVDRACKLGEGPIWHAAEQALYWADIPLGRLYRFDPASGHDEMVLEDRLLGAIVVQEDGSLLLLRDEGNVVCLRDGVLETIIDAIPGEAAFNDAIADPKGRIFSGTCAAGKEDCPGEYERYGRLYRIDTDGSYRVVDDGMICSNGLGFSLDRKCMYFTDSGFNSIYVYDYDEETGGISDRRIFAETSGSVKPDGLTVDAEDHVWSAQWEGGRIVRYTPDGDISGKLELTTPLITSVMFGGEALGQLYVTSAGGDDRAGKGSDAGVLYRITGSGPKGKPEFLSRIALPEL